MTICDGCDGILYSVSVVKISSLSSRPSRKGETWKENHRCRYPKDLLLALFQYHLAGNEEYLPEIEKALMEKLDSMVKRQLYTTFKTAPTEEEREKARQEYLDKCGMHENFRW
ncbi:MAG: complexin-2 [Mediterraneibacter gnavus]